MYTVTMRNSITDANGVIWEFEAVDHVPAEDLNAYVADAQTRWGTINVTEETTGDSNGS